MTEVRQRDPRHADSFLSAPVNERWLTGVVAFVSLLSVAPLLAWVFGLGSFASWFRLVALPSLVFLLAVAFWIHRQDGYGRLRTAMLVGALGGFLGTILYDAARIPFVAGGMRLFAPIDSYGVLLVDASASNGLTDFAGWAYHFLNGICFGIAYAAVMLGRRRAWAVGYAMVLESAAVVTPFALVYGLRSNPGVIAIAYLGHVPYGLAVGYFAREGSAMREKLLEVSERPATIALTALVVVLAIWLQPQLAAPVTAETDVRNGRFMRQYLRVPVDGCVRMHNLDERSYVVSAAKGSPELAAGATADLCFGGIGVARVKLSDGQYSGGFVIVDPEMSPIARADQREPQ